MSEAAITIRMVEEGDTEALLAIYAPYVEKTAIISGYKAPTIQELKNHVTSTLKRCLYLVVVRDRRTLGYAYVFEFKERVAYDWVVETSAYMPGDTQHTDADFVLCKALENYLRRQNVINVNACIAYPSPGSIAFHEEHGYCTVGHSIKYGYEPDRW